MGSSADVRSGIDAVGLYGPFYELIHFAGLIKIPLHNPPETGITFFSLYLVVGIVLLKAANRIVVFAYGETAPEDDT